MKNKIKTLMFFALGLIIPLFGVYAVNYPTYNANRVSHDTSTSMDAADVQGSVDILYQNAVDYRELKNLLLRDGMIHNSFYRGRDVTEYLDDGSLFTRISSGKFTDLYIGDYIVKNDITWRIAAFDYYYGKGNSTAATTHHAVIIPDTTLVTALGMNSSNTSTGGYVGSRMYKTTLPALVDSTGIITTTFGDNHVIEFSTYLTNTINASRYNRYGRDTGAATARSLYTLRVVLMNAIQLVGTVHGGNAYDAAGADSIQFPLFRLKPEMISISGGVFWLREVRNSSGFSVGTNVHGVTGGNASASYGVRPYFVID